jgi:hypothetical protein
MGVIRLVGVEGPVEKMDKRLVDIGALGETGVWLEELAGGQSAGHASAEARLTYAAMR